jgi:hypothetical protein
VVTQADSTRCSRRISARVGPRASFVLEDAEDDDLAMPAVVESEPNAVQMVLRRSCPRTIATGDVSRGRPMDGQGWRVRRRRG